MDDGEEEVEDGERRRWRRWKWRRESYEPDNFLHHRRGPSFSLTVLGARYGARPDRCTHTCPHTLSIRPICYCTWCARCYARDVSTPADIGTQMKSPCSPAPGPRSPRLHRSSPLRFLMVAGSL